MAVLKAKTKMVNGVRTPIDTPPVVNTNLYAIPGENRKTYQSRIRNDGGLTKAEPSVLSTDSGETSFNTNVVPTINEANKTIETATTNSKENTKKTTNEKDRLKKLGLSEDNTNKTPEQIGYEDSLKSLDDEKNTVEKTYRDLVTSASANARTEINSLGDVYNERLKDLTKSNDTNLKTWQQQFIRSGQSEYSPGMTGDFLTAKEFEGLKKVKELDTTYQNAVAGVNAALSEKKFSAAANLANQIRAIEKEIRETTANNIKEAKKINDQVKLNNAVYNAYASGIEDTADVYEFITEQGVKTSIKDVNDIMKIINPDADMTGLTADYKTYKAMKKAEEIPDTWTYFDYERAVTNANKKATVKSTTTKKVVGSPSMTFEEFVSQKLPTVNGAKTMPTSPALLEQLRTEYEAFVESSRVEVTDPTKNYTSTNIPKEIDEQLRADIEANFPLEDLYKAYEDVSSSYVNSLTNSLRKKTKDDREI